jgi:hypothetical protein
MTRDRGTKERSLKLSSGGLEHSFGARPDGEGGGWLVFEVDKALLIAIKRFESRSSRCQLHRSTKDFHLRCQFIGLSILI